MLKNYAASSFEAIETFQSLVKKPLQDLLGGDIFSIEEEAQASAPAAKALDTSASSDLVVQYQTTTAVYMAASRIMFNAPEALQYPISITLRNSKNGSYANTELNKLHTASGLLRGGMPVVIPRYLCYARVMPAEKPVKLYDLLAIETIPLIANVFDSARLNLPGMRLRMETNKAEEVLFDEKLNWLAGIRTNKDATFVFLSRKYLDINALPYLYRKI